MSFHLLHCYAHKWTTWIGLVPLSFALAARAQTPTCPAVAEHDPTPAETAYLEGRFAAAQDLYEQALAKNPQDINLNAAMVRTLLRENRLLGAITQLNPSLAANPHAAPLLTVQAEIQYRQGQPWQAMQTLDAALAANPCYAQAHLVRAQVLRIDSMYASERVEIQKAYDIDPKDPDIQHAWLTVDSPANDVAATAQALASTDVDAETRKKAEAADSAMMSLFYETSQTCKVVSTDAAATIPLQAMLPDGKHIDGYRTDVDFPQGKGKMIVDTSASGLYITKALADLNGFQPGPGDPPNTVRATMVKVGPIEFHDCLVGVTDTPFSGKADGFLGTDIFDRWLITLDPRQSKMFLAPLPPGHKVLPGDRTVPPELADYTPVYHRRQYLLVPLTFGTNARELFALATGMRVSAMTSDVAHSLSKMTFNFTNTETTTTGAKIQSYREIFDIKMADLPQIHQGHILELDPTVMNHNTGFQVAGMLGLDVLQPLILHIDYRDGLVKFEPVSAEFDLKKRTMIASNTPASATVPEAECAVSDPTPRPLNSIIQAKVTGSLDSGRLKPGKEIWVKVVNGYTFPGCSLDADAILYGRVISATSTKGPDASELSVAFDRGDCTGHMRKQLALHLIGLVGPPDQSRKMHGEIPVEVAGGVQQVGGSRNGQDAVSELGGMDEELNPGGPPHTIHPGIVVNIPKVKLEPEGGPGCSARLTSTSRSVELGPGSQLLLTMAIVPQ